ncbi:hypothetical protein RJ640_023339 [Escallonia rubra]|uniref:Leucine-rich repeat-containing N-terminal plant-type domain-containing protein n=1 Tax=Escallonia rubra TaxID=112253 RepID=A0AA88UFQ6_9ASTE|nr:hypothetical protein RJ640_023339 [Escallonia rubra]
MKLTTLSLLAFKSMISDDPQGVLDSWNTSFHFCQWEGVTCGHQHRRVTVLDLRLKTLTGSISPYIGNLSFLQRISLSHNFLQVGKIPLELTYLSKLEMLIIHYNNLTQGIPPSIGNLTSLLGLCDPFFHLQSFLTYNVGSKWKSVSRNSSIRHRLHSSIPSLQVLDVWGNRLSGPIPLSIANASQLSRLVIDSNNFTGQVSVNFRNLEQLSYVELGDNSLGTGKYGDLSFLSSLANCSSLPILEQSINNFGGPLPNFVANLSSQLTSYKIAENQVSGSIPLGIANLAGLTILAMDGNHLTGRIPLKIGNLHRLQRVALNYNLQPTRRRYSTLSRKPFSFLNELHLENNTLEGTIPPSLGNCKLLVLLNLSHNNLNGTIPSQLFGASALSNSLNLAPSRLSGSLPSEIGHLITLGELDVSNNELSGVIPSSLGSCTGLEWLNMGGNFYQGSILSSLSSLKGVQNLDLSRNDLSGDIPDFFGKAFVEASKPKL